MIDHNATLADVKTGELFRFSDNCLYIKTNTGEVRRVENAIYDTASVAQEEDIPVTVFRWTGK